MAVFSSLDGREPDLSFVWGPDSFKPYGMCGSLSFSAACSLVRFFSASHEFFYKSYLQKTVVNCHENLEGFQIMTVKAVEERGCKTPVCLLGW